MSSSNLSISKRFSRAWSIAGRVVRRRKLAQPGAQLWLATRQLTRLRRSPVDGFTRSLAPEEGPVEFDVVLSEELELIEARRKFFSPPGAPAPAPAAGSPAPAAGRPAPRGLGKKIKDWLRLRGTS